MTEGSLSDEEIIRKLKCGIHLEDRTYQFRLYRKCFVGCDMVDFMVQARIVPSREEAVTLGNELMTYNHLFEHVTREHRFEDEFLFYRFGVTEGTADSTERSYADNDVDCDNDDVEKSRQELSIPELNQIGEQLRRGVKIKHRQYRLRTYKNCFVASDAVNYLVHSGLAESRRAAVSIIRRLQVELGFVHHVTNEHEFEGTMKKKLPRVYARKKLLDSET